MNHRLNDSDLQSYQYRLYQSLAYIRGCTLLMADPCPTGGVSADTVIIHLSYLCNDGEYRYYERVHYLHPN